MEKVLPETTVPGRIFHLYNVCTSKVPVFASYAISAIFRTKKMKRSNEKQVSTRIATLKQKRTISI